MPRTARVLMPNTPHYIYQCGHNRGQVFFENNDYQQYLYNLNECKNIYNIRIYCYCLLYNQIHLLIEPDRNAKNISNFMKRVSGRQSRYTNVRYSRSGSLWDGRFKSKPVDNDDLIKAYWCYINYLPLHSGLIKNPESYSWSSLAYHKGHRQHDIIDNITRVDQHSFTYNEQNNFGFNLIRAVAGENFS
ncbi:MAG: transposase [Gammaproteobacteria bacterium]|nr:transposase [Gammaproteobacteria bacterium]